MARQHGDRRRRQYGVARTAAGHGGHAGPRRRILWRTVESARTRRHDHASRGWTDPAVLQRESVRHVAQGERRADGIMDTAYLVRSANPGRTARHVRQTRRRTSGSCAGDTRLERSLGDPRAGLRAKWRKDRGSVAHVRRPAALRRDAQRRRTQGAARRSLRSRSVRHGRQDRQRYQAGVRMQPQQSHGHPQRRPGPARLREDECQAHDGHRGRSVLRFCRRAELPIHGRSGARGGTHHRVTYGEQDPRTRRSSRGLCRSAT